MSATVASSSVCVCAARPTKRPVPVQASLGNSAGLKPQGSLVRSLQAGSKNHIALPGPRRCTGLRQNVQTSAAMEVFQVADELGYISGVAGVTFAITLVGLAVGFVLLRIEALTEEGKL